MFITKILNSRQLSVAGCGLYRKETVNDIGLGLAVTVTTRFDPQRMKIRFTYWLDKAANEIAEQVHGDIRAAGMEPNDDSKETYRRAAIAQGISGIVVWSSTVSVPKGPSAVKTYGMMAAQLAVGIALPWVGIAWAVSSLFGKKKKKKMSTPWNAIYAAAMPYAQSQTKAEELNRIAEEGQRIQQERFVEVQKVRGRAVEFKLPELVKGIDRGALVVSPVGPAIIRKIV